MTRVVCCQLEPTIGRLDRNVEMASAAIRAAASDGAEVIVLPELVTSGYYFESVDEARSVAIAADDPILGRCADEAGGAVVAAGFAERSGDTLYNSAVLISGTGQRTVYRKAHLWDREKIFFTPGDGPPPVVDTPVGRIGLMICYDLEFPEMTRAVALRGAQLLVVPTNWPLVERPGGMPAPEVIIAMAAARVNRMPIACCDRSGVERGKHWTEATTIISADGWPLATAGADGVACADLDLQQSKNKRICPRNDVHADLRPDIYR